MPKVKSSRALEEQVGGAEVTSSFNKKKSRKEEVLKPELVRKYALKPPPKPNMKDTPIKIPQYKPQTFSFMQPYTPKGPATAKTLQSRVTAMCNTPSSQIVSSEKKPQWFYSRPLPTTMQQTSRNMYMYTNAWGNAQGGNGSASRQDFELSNPWMNV